MPPTSDRRGSPGRRMTGGALFAASLLLIAVPLPAQQTPSGQMIELELQMRDPESGVISTTRAPNSRMSWTCRSPKPPDIGTTVHPRRSAP